MTSYTVSSRVEGAWEGETLARIAGLYLLRATRQREIGINLKPIIDKARRLSCRVEPVEEIEDFSQAAAELHQIENFAPAEWINGLKVPMANGDIFEIQSDSPEETAAKHFVMVCQPCDLAVRSDGRTRGTRGASAPDRGEEKATGDPARAAAAFLAAGSPSGGSDGSASRRGST